MATAIGQITLLFAIANGVMMWMVRAICGQSQSWVVSVMKRMHKEMSMDDYKEMYAEYCIENDLVGAPGIRLQGVGFNRFVAWRKRVEKYFENISDSS